MDYSQLPLRAMQVPEAIGWWPPAPGWWLLALLVVVLLYLTVRWIRQRLQNPSRFALAELKSIERAYQTHQNPRQLLIHCNALLKRMALTLYPREEVADLSGDAWVDFLQRSGSISAWEQLVVLATGPYQPQPDVDPEALLAICRLWIKRVRVVKHV
ncbi:DUF4381 domain-containing protein [Pontibacter sp. JAM-7]|uniref:DUF4381 domain-containing protein n=1 Tax=Pontibacter sp. JAM-7 TaxID=3366581 RepID=UPI003AF6AD8C